MPAKNATRQARKAKSPSAQAGEYVRAEIEHVEELVSGVEDFERMFTPPGTRSQGLSGCWYRDFSL